MKQFELTNLETREKRLIEALKYTTNWLYYDTLEHNLAKVREKISKLK